MIGASATRKLVCTTIRGVLLKHELDVIVMDTSGPNPTRDTWRRVGIDKTSRSWDDAFTLTTSEPIPHA